MGEVAVGAGDACREADARGLAVDPGGIGLAEGGFPGGALAGRCRRLARTRLGDLQVGGALQGFADQLVELPVAEPGPPVLARPGRW